MPNRFDPPTIFKPYGILTGEKVDKMNEFCYPNLIRFCKIGCLDLQYFNILNSSKLIK